MLYAKAFVTLTEAPCSVWGPATLWALLTARTLNPAHITMIIGCHATESALALVSDIFGLTFSNNHYNMHLA